ncbi:hypothetical protein [Prochlorococcus sp. ALOHA_ZT_50]|uniref:hypothetical protein n=1 Tax=Prochlorococcus sp. ALOHA_ZT_50 TaxID=2919303 RepID=UPI00257E0101|nr:hypothetical protein [Prochlorococcus sp. ALOHA_ZT_50]MCH2079616.1 hypothetical protein [Prochlorococcus sp. ALOHA_ZT_50]
MSYSELDYQIQLHHNALCELKYSEDVEDQELFNKAVTCLRWLEAEHNRRNSSAINEENE